MGVINILYKKNYVDLKVKIILGCYRLFTPGTLPEYMGCA